jgi:PAS domain S-box-containing protein
MSIIHKRLQLAELRNSGMLYRKVIENLPHRISVKDANLAYVFCNEAYAHDLNITPNEISGKSDYDFFPKELAEKMITEENEILISGAKKETAEKYVVSGKELTILATKTPVKNANGDIIGLQVVLQDITKDKRRTESFEFLIKNLEDLLAQGKVINDALKIDLKRITARRNLPEVEIKNLRKLLRKSLKQIQNMVNAAQHLTGLSHSKDQ